MTAEMTPAESACTYIMGQVFRDPRLAYLIGPGSETYRRLTDVMATLRGMSGDEYRADAITHITTEATVSRSMYDALEAALDKARSGL